MKMVLSVLAMPYTATVPTSDILLHKGPPPELSIGAEVFINPAEKNNLCSAFAHSLGCRFLL